jgi:hypothetical protein
MSRYIRYALGFISGIYMTHRYSFRFSIFDFRLHDDALL